MPSASNLDLVSLHDAIVEAFRVHFGDLLRDVSAFTPALLTSTSPDVQTPAALIDLERMTSAEDDGTGRNAITCDFCVYCVLSRQTDRAELQVRNFAAQAYALIERNRWGFAGDAVDLPTLITAQPDASTKGPTDAQSYESWCVQWQQVVRLGPCLHEPPIPRPHTVWLGFWPETGPAHVDDYLQVKP